MIFAVIPNLTRENAYSVTCEFLKEAERLNCTSVIDSTNKEVFKEFDFVKYSDIEEAIKECDMVVSVGGDGTFINSAKSALKYNKPVLCINAGKLAYLACFEKEDIPLLTEICKGNYSIEKRMLLEASIIDKNGKILYHSNCINDAVVSRSGNIRIMKLSLFCNNAPIIQYFADGIIVSTPTGSTAYSLSAGGPVIEPQVESILVTPVCSHTVFSRSVVLRDDSLLEIVHDNSGEAILSCDGKKAVLIPENAKVVIKRSNDYAEFVKVKNDTFIDILSKKISS